MKGNSPDMAISGPCDCCGQHVDYCDGDKCDECGNWTCYECGTHFDKKWLCPHCAEAAQLEEEAEEELDPVAPNYRDWFKKQGDKREAKAMALDEARGK